MKKILVMLALVLTLSACRTNITVAEAPQTMQNWQQALEMRNAERYELAYHYYTIALSSATTENAVVQLKKEMEDLQRVIKSVR